MICSGKACGEGRRGGRMRGSVRRYLRSLWEDHASGEAVAETSRYGALLLLESRLDDYEAAKELCHEWGGSR